MGARKLRPLGCAFERRFLFGASPDRRRTSSILAEVVRRPALTPQIGPQVAAFRLIDVGYLLLDRITVLNDPSN